MGQVVNYIDGVIHIKFNREIDDEIVDVYCEELVRVSEDVDHHLFFFDLHGVSSLKIIHYKNKIVEAHSRLRPSRPGEKGAVTGVDMAFRSMMWLLSMVSGNGKKDDLRFFDNEDDAVSWLKEGL